MSRALITEARLTDIADAIRARNGAQTTYRPGDMPAAIAALPNVYGAGDEGKVVSNGTLVAQTARAVIEANGTYDTTTNDSITVNVSGGGGDWPFVDEIVEGGTGMTVNVSGDRPLDLNALPANIRAFYDDYCKTPKPTTEHYDIDITDAEAGLTLNALMAAHRPKANFEYSGNTYGNDAMIEALGLVLLGDFSQGGSASGNVLSQSIYNFSGVILNGIYQKSRTSNYNTSMLYQSPDLNTAYWAGMKDRNSSYNCYVTFTDGTHCDLTNRYQVIVYGIP